MIDWSARGRARVWALTALGTAACIAVAFAVDSYSFETGRWRWGSDPLNNLLIPLILAPPFVLDYLAAHEVAHLHEMNHGPRFWHLVESVCPETKQARAWLNREGLRLHAIGAEPGRTPMPLTEDDRNAA